MHRLFIQNILISWTFVRSKIDFDDLFKKRTNEFSNLEIWEDNKISNKLYANFVMDKSSQITEQEESCSCYPYGFHIHTDFVKFAEEQLAAPIAIPTNDMSIKTIHAPKAKMWCSKRTSVNSMVMNRKSLQTDELLENAKVRPMKRESALIQKRILNLHSCTPKTNEEIYGRGLLDAIKEFENFVTKAWGKKSSCNTSNLGIPKMEANQNCKAIQHPRQIKTEDKGSSGHGTTTNVQNQSTDVNTDRKEVPSSRTQGMNTESSMNISIGTNTLAVEPTPVVRTEPLSKLTIRTQKPPSSQQPDCGGDVGVKNEMKCEEPEVTSSIEEFENPSSEEQRELDHTPKDPSPDMTVALKVVNEALMKGRTGQDVAGALSITQTEWFEKVGGKDAYASDVASYLTSFEGYSPQLLRYMVNLPDANGITALHYAVSYGNFQVVSKLLDTNVTDPNKPNKAGYTSIMLASLAEIKNGEQEKIVRKLISLGDVNMKAAQHGQTALMLAASHGRFKMVKLLLQGGSDVNAQDEDGSSALMCAVEHGHADIVQCLLAQPGCDPNLADNDGLTALNVAMEAGHKDIAVLLYAHMHFVKPTIPPPESLVQGSLVPKKQSRSTTNIPSRSVTAPSTPTSRIPRFGRSSVGRNDKTSVARKQRSSIN